MILYAHQSHLLYFFFFFFNDTATTEIYTLSLHDALPIEPGAAIGAGRPLLPNTMPLPGSTRCIKANPTPTCLSSNPTRPITPRQARNRLNPGYRSRTEPSSAITQSGLCATSQTYPSGSAN